MQDFITTQELKSALEHPHTAPLLLEALGAPHYEREHLPGARNLPLDGLGARAAALVNDPQREIVVYCTGPSCQNSHTAAARLRQLGYGRVRVYAEGKEGWRSAGFAFERGSDPLPLQPHAG